MEAVDNSHLLALEDMTGVAIATVLAAGALHNYGISGLEVHQYSNGVWNTWKPTEIATAELNFKKMEPEIKKLIQRLGNRKSG
jgi:hypothetical protein